MSSDDRAAMDSSDRVGENPGLRRVPPDARLTQALGDAVRAASAPLGGHPPESDDLRLAVCEFVVWAKAQRAFPESVLVALKEHVQRSEVSRLDRATNEVIVSQIVRWAIEEYYRDD